MADDLGFVRQVSAPAGSVVIFNEALVHGTFPWQPEEHIAGPFCSSIRRVSWPGMSPAMPDRRPHAGRTGAVRADVPDGETHTGRRKEEYDVIYAHKRPIS